MPISIPHNSNEHEMYPPTERNFMRLLARYAGAMSCIVIVIFMYTHYVRQNVADLVGAMFVIVACFLIVAFYFVEKRWKFEVRDQELEVICKQNAILVTTISVLFAGKRQFYRVLWNPRKVSAPVRLGTDVGEGSIRVDFSNKSRVLCGVALG